MNYPIQYKYCFEYKYDYMYMNLYETFIQKVILIIDICLSKRTKWIGPITHDKPIEKALPKAIMGDTNLKFKSRYNF